MLKAKPLFLATIVCGLGGSLIWSCPQAKAVSIVTRPHPGIYSATATPGPTPSAQDANITIIPIHEHVEDGTHLAIAPVVEPAATVSRALAQQPVFPYLVHVRLGATTLYLDPYARIQPHGQGRLDENNILIRATRLARSLRANTSPYLVTRPGTHRKTHASMPTPVAIIAVPSFDDPSAHPGDLMPSVPRPQDVPGIKMARAEE